MLALCDSVCHGNQIGLFSTSLSTSPSPNGYIMSHILMVPHSFFNVVAVSDSLSLTSELRPLTEKGQNGGPWHQTVFMGKLSSTDVIS